MGKAIFIIIIISLLMYHGCVIKAEKNYEVRIYGQWQNGKISKEEYQRLKRENNYFKYAFNLKEVFSAWE